MTGRLHFITLNARGLIEKQKRDQIMLWIKNQKADVIFLQETHYTKSIIPFIETEWSGSLFHSFGTSNSRGVSVLISNSAPVTVIDHQQTDDGRVVLVNIEVNDSMYTVVNVYAPNKGRDREQFFEKLSQWIADHHKGLIIMGGDFNTVLNVELDRKSDGVKRHVNNKNIKRIMSRFNLKDIWRVKHAKLLQYTWRQRQPPVASRLDFWLVEKTIVCDIKSCDIRPAVKTDHQAVSLKLEFENAPRGPGTWKLNVSLLEDTWIKNKITHTIYECVKLCKKSNLDSVRTWELCKVKVRETFMECAKLKRNNQNKSGACLQKELEELSQIIDTGEATPDHEIRYRELHDQLEKHYEKQAKGAQVRSRAAWVEKGERSTGYFFGLEKNKQSQRCISSVKNTDGKVIKEQNAILTEINKYYSTLYSSKGVTQADIDSYLETVELDYTLSEQDRQVCEGPLTTEECKQGVQHMKCNKSPGSDGLPVEFYSAFWPIVVVNSLNAGYTNGSMSVTQKHAIIKLLYKKKDPELLDNWRPISLLNIDYKIATTAFARRLQCVLDKIISTDQSGYIKGRYIGHSIRLIKDIMDYAKDEDLGGAVLFLDFRKAFDMVEWPFMIAALRHFGFGETFVKWVQTLYSRTTSCVNNNGWLSDNFEIHRGIRQGCPLSALLFIIVVECMATKIRKNDGIRGIKIKGTNKEVKITQLADDTTIFAADKPSILSCIQTVNEFSAVAGPELNLLKTECLWLGKDRHSNEKIGGLQWPIGLVKALGIYFGYNEEECSKSNWDPKIDKLESKLRAWKKRNLTLIGKILIVKSLGLSQLVYNAAVLCTPHNVVKRVTDMIYKFIWDGKRDKIKRTTLIGDYSIGGLRAPDVQSLFTSLKARWVYRIYADEACSNWSLLPRMYLEQYGTALSILKMNLNRLSCLPGSLPPFYKEVMGAWLQCGGCSTKKPNTFYEVRNQFIWGNKFILFKNKPLFYNHWIQSGICYVNDLLDKSNQISEKAIFERLGQRNNWAAECYTVLHSIPREWKGILQTDDSKRSSVRCSHVLNRYDVKKGYVEDCSSKSLYNLLVSQKHNKCYLERYWSLKFDRSYSASDWENIWLLTKYVQERKLAIFRYKLLHSILPNQLLLHRWHLTDTPLCNVCGVVEDYEHLFVKCKMVKEVWQFICESFTKIGLENIVPNLKFIVIGYKEFQKEYLEVNEVLLICGFAIFKSYCKSQNWMTRVNVKATVKAELNCRNSYYSRKLRILKRLCDTF